jgi:hypothetical protein
MAILGAHNVSVRERDAELRAIADPILRRYPSGRRHARPFRRRSEARKRSSALFAFAG